MAALVGPRSKDARRFLVLAEGADGDQAVPALALSVGRHLRVVRVYRHLGVMATATSPIGQEIALRTAAGRLAHTALSKAVFNKGDLPTAARIGMAVACVHSR